MRSSSVPAVTSLRTPDGALLPDAVGAVGGLVLDGGVPPAVEVHDVLGGGQRDPGAARRAARAGTTRGPLRLWNRSTIVVAGLPADPAVQPRDLGVEAGGEVRGEHVAERRVLREQQRLVPRGEHLGEDLLEPRDLPRPPSDRGAVVQQQRGVVADLLELGHRREHPAAALDARLHVVDRVEHLVDDDPVERGLLGGQPAALDGLDLVRQVVDHRRVGLEPAQQERARAPAQVLGDVGAPVALDGDGVALAEGARGAEHARVDRVHDRPQLGEPVLHGRAGQREAVLGVEAADGLRAARAVVLDHLGLVEHDAVPGDARRGPRSRGPACRTR